MRLRISQEPRNATCGDPARHALPGCDMVTASQERADGF
jgi:hypothetical protein